MFIYFMIVWYLSSLLGADGGGQCLIGEYSGHSAAVYGLCSLPRGEGSDNEGGEGVRFISASSDLRILEWVVGQPSFVGEYKGHISAVLCVESLGGNRFMSGGADGKVIVWEVGNYSPIKIISFHIGDVRAVLDLKDGSALSASHDRKIFRFNVVTGEKMMTYTGHTHFVTCLALVPDGSFLSGSYDYKIRRWNRSSPFSIVTYTFSTFVSCITVLSPSFFLVAGGSATTSSLMKFKIGTLSAVFTFTPVHTKQINSISLLPDLSFITGGGDGLLLRWVDGLKDPVTNYTNPGNGQIWSTATLTDGSLVAGLANTQLTRHKTNGNVASLSSLLSLSSVPSLLPCGPSSLLLDNGDLSHILYPLLPFPQGTGPPQLIMSVVAPVCLMEITLKSVSVS
jgi:WD40 repeat protein